MLPLVHPSGCWTEETFGCAGKPPMRGCYCLLGVGAGAPEYPRKPFVGPPRHHGLMQYLCSGRENFRRCRELRGNIFS